jgi:site-specific recombinase XerD
MVAYWREQARPLIKSRSFKGLRLSKITIEPISVYQSERLASGKASKTVNGELSVLRQLLKHARLWFRFQEDYKPDSEQPAPVGKALTHEDVERLFDVARSRSDWRLPSPQQRFPFSAGCGRARSSRFSGKTSTSKTA